MLGLCVSSKLDWGYCIVSVAKTASKIIETCIRSMKLLYSEVSIQSLPHNLVWNTVVMSALVLPSDT